MFFDPPFPPKKIIWPPPLPLHFGILDLLVAPEYMRGMDLNNKDAWGVDQWRAYARYLEESGKSLIDSLEQKHKETETELTIQRVLASRRKQSKESLAFRESMKNSEKARLIRTMMNESPTASLINPARPIEKINTKNPLQGILSIFERPTKKRGRPKDENLQSLRYAQLALQKRSNGEFKSDWEALKSVYDDLGLSRRKGDSLNKTQSRHILNQISKLRNHNNSKR